MMKDDQRQTTDDWGFAAAVWRGRPALLLVIPIIAVWSLSAWMQECRFHAALTPDSISYLAGAHWFGAGQGISTGEPNALTPMTHWAPLYPVALATAAMLGQPEEKAALTINCWSLGLSLLFIGLVVWRLSKSLWAALAAQMLAAVAREYLRLHIFALSEPLFLALTWGGVWALVEYQLRRRPVWLALGAVLLALSVMSRYAGAGIVLGAGLYLVWQSRARLRDAVALWAVALGPMALWIASRQEDGRRGVGRVVGFETPAMDNLSEGIATMGYFLSPEAWPVTACILGEVFLGILLFGVLFRRTRLIGCVGFGYLAFILASLTLVDHGIPLDMRILLPAGVSALIIVATAAGMFMRSLPTWRHRTAFLLALTLLMLGYYDLRQRRAWTELRTYASHGYGFECYSPERSPIMAKALHLPVDVAVVSGNPDALHYLIGRTGLPLPMPAANAGHPSVRRIAEAAAGAGAVFVDVRRLNGDPDGAAEERVRRWFDLELMAQEMDGRLYRITEKVTQDGRGTPRSGPELGRGHAP
jgi:hypothetical protein